MLFSIYSKSEDAILFGVLKVRIEGAYNYKTSENSRLSKCTLYVYDDWFRLYLLSYS